MSFLYISLAKRCALLQGTNCPRFPMQKATSWNKNTKICKIEDQITEMDPELDSPNNPQETSKHAYFMRQALLMVNITEHTSPPDAHHQPGRKSPPDR